MQEIHCLMLSLREIFVLEMNQCVARSLYLWYWGFCAWWVDVKSIVSVPVVALVSLVWATTSVGCALNFGFPLFSVVFLFSCFVLCFCTCVFPFPFPWCFCLWWWYLLSESHRSWLFMWGFLYLRGGLLWEEIIFSCPVAYFLAVSLFVLLPCSCLSSSLWFRLYFYCCWCWISVFVFFALVLSLPLNYGIYIKFSLLNFLVTTRNFQSCRNILNYLWTGGGVFNWLIICTDNSLNVLFRGFLFDCWYFAYGLFGGLYFFFHIYILF